MFNLFKKLFKKKEVMIAPEAKEIYFSKSFQWRRGDYFGTVEKFKDLIEEDGETFFVFTSGRRVKSSIIKEFMDIHEDPDFKDDLSNQISKVEIDNSLNQPIIQEKVETKILSVQTPYPIQPTKIEKELDPVQMILEKQKPNIIKLNINLKLNIPSKELYQTLNLSFDDADESIVEWITQNLDMEDIKAGIKGALKDIYKEASKRRVNGSNKV